MEYILIFIFEFCGVSFSIGKSVIQENNKTPKEDTIPIILKKYLRNNFVTLYLSIVVVIMNFATHYVIGLYGHGLIIKIFSDMDTYKLCSMLFAFFLGWGGQAFFYRVLGKMDGYLQKKIDDKLQ